MCARNGVRGATLKAERARAPARSGASAERRLETLRAGLHNAHYQCPDVAPRHTGADNAHYVRRRCLNLPATLRFLRAGWLGFPAHCETFEHPRWESSRRRCVPAKVERSDMKEGVGARPRASRRRWGWDFDGGMAPAAKPRARSTRRSRWNRGWGTVRPWGGPPAVGASGMTLMGGGDDESTHHNFSLGDSMGLLNRGLWALPHRKRVCDRRGRALLVIRGTSRKSPLPLPPQKEEEVRRGGDHQADEYAGNEDVSRTELGRVHQALLPR